MKKVVYLFTLSIVFLSCGVFENEQEVCEEGTYLTVVEEPPVLIGGLSELYKKVVYPPHAKARGIQGRVVVQFIVNEEGKVICPSVVRGIGGGCDEAAVKAVLQSEFTPGIQNGEPVRVQYSLPVSFILDN